MLPKPSQLIMHLSNQGHCQGYYSHINARICIVPLSSVGFTHSHTHTCTKPPVAADSSDSSRSLKIKLRCVCLCVVERCVQRLCFHIGSHGIWFVHEVMWSLTHVIWHVPHVKWLLAEHNNMNLFPSQPKQYCAQWRSKNIETSTKALCNHSCCQGTHIPSKTLCVFMFMLLDMPNEMKDNF